MKILIVDDNEEDRYLLVFALQAKGFEVVTAGDGAAALELLRAARVDLIVSDILMPIMDGYQFCRECKSDAALRDIPFIFYSGTYRDKEDESLAMSLGAVKYVAKPEEPGVFINLVQELIREAQEGGLTTTREPLVEEPVFLKQYNARLIKKLEDKLVQLQDANKALEREIGEHRKAAQYVEAGTIRLQTVIETVGEGITLSDRTGRFWLYNSKMEEITGYTREEAAVSRDFLLLLYPDAAEYSRALADLAELVRRRGCREKETAILAKDGSRKHLLISSTLIADKEGDLYLTVYRDITARKKAEAERERLILELQEALQRVHQLSGLLPICASCKKIRDGEGSWRQIELYIRDHSEAQFTHGLCPECAAKLRAEWQGLNG